MSKANVERDGTIARQNDALAEMSAVNTKRDDAIATLSDRVRDLTGEVDALRHELADLRRRSLRLPTRLARWFQRSHGPS
jgi:hypothetical protein